MRSTEPRWALCLGILSHGQTTARAGTGAAPRHLLSLHTSWMLILFKLQLL